MKGKRSFKVLNVDFEKGIIKLEAEIKTIGNKAFYIPLPTNFGKEFKGKKVIVEVKVIWS